MFGISPEEVGIGVDYGAGRVWRRGWQGGTEDDFAVSEALLERIRIHGVAP